MWTGSSAYYNFLAFFYGTALNGEIYTFYMGCMFKEITRYYCKPDMTSSLFCRKGAVHAIFHGGFWKSDYDFLIVILSNFLSAMHGFRDNEVLLPTGYEVNVSLPPGGAARTFSWRILKERLRLPDQSSFISYTWYMSRANIVSINIQNKLRRGNKKNK